MGKAAAAQTPMILDRLYCPSIPDSFCDCIVVILIPLSFTRLSIDLAQSQQQAYETPSIIAHTWQAGCLTSAAQVAVVEQVSGESNRWPAKELCFTSLASKSEINKVLDSCLQ